MHVSVERHTGHFARPNLGCGRYLTSNGEEGSVTVPENETLPMPAS